MLCGSLPPGVPSNLYANLIHEARKRNVKTLLDTDGDALLEGVEARAHGERPPINREAERLLNTALLTRTHYLSGGRTDLTRWAPKPRCFSLAARGAIGAFPGGMVEVIPPRVEAVSPIGSGDARTAAFLWSMENKPDYAEALRWGVAAGTASAKLPGMKFASLPETREVYAHVAVRRLELARSTVATGSIPANASARSGSDGQPGANIARSAGVVSAAVLTSRVTGLVRESLMAALFGASQSYDAFVLGFRIPNLMRDLFAEGGLSSAFVPIFTRYLTTKTREEALRLYNLVATAIIMIVGALCACSAWRPARRLKWVGLAHVGRARSSRVSCRFQQFVELAILVAVPAAA